jgi:hypothetical protein
MVAKDIKANMRKVMISIMTLIKREASTNPVRTINNSNRPKLTKNTLKVTKSSTVSLDNTKRTIQIMNMISKSNISSIKKIMPMPTHHKLKESLILSIDRRI